MTPQPSIDPERVEQVTSAFAEYLDARLGSHAIAGMFELLADGTDTFVYGFRLEGIERDAPWAGPLVARIFRSGADAARAAREAAVQQFAREGGCSTPTILRFERDGANLGLPFAVMRRAGPA